MPNVSGESPLNPSRPAVLPRTFGRYELRAVTSANRWGVIFEAADPEAGGEPRAVGVLDPLLMNVPGLAPLFVSTAQHATGRVHPSLVRVYEAGFERNLAYVVSEWLQGWDLHGVLRRCRSSGRPLPARHALTLGTWAAEALAALHAPEPDLPNGAIHGRLAADKLFVREDGRFKLIGIGLPEVGQELWPLPDDVDHYALLAPEQLGDGVADHRADVYTLCVLVTTMCTGQNPFQRASIAKTAAAITSGDMKPCTTDRRMAPDLEMLLRRGMFVDPSQRPSSVAEIAEGLRPILASLGGPVEPEEWATFLKALFHSDGHRPEGIREIEIQERASRVMTAMDRWSPASMPQFDASRIMTPSAPSPLPPDEATEETPAAATRTPVSIEGPAPHLPAPPPKAAAPSRRAPVLVGLGVLAVLAAGGAWLALRPSPVAVSPAPVAVVAPSPAPLAAVSPAAPAPEAPPPVAPEVAPVAAAPEVAQAPPVPEPVVASVAPVAKPAPPKPAPVAKVEPVAKAPDPVAEPKPAPLAVAAVAPVPAPKAAPPEAAPVAETFLEDVSVDVSAANVVVSATLSGKAVRPFHYLDQQAGSAGTTRYVVKLKGVTTKAGVSRLPVAAPGVRGVTVRQDGGAVVLAVECDCTDEDPVRFTQSGTSFQLVVPTTR